MPSRKAINPVTSTPPSKSSGSRALTVWEQRMADAAKKSAKAEKPVSGLSGISLRGGVLSIDDTPVKGNEMDVVVLVSMHVNEWHNQPYNPDVPQIPACYAFGEVDADDPEDRMAPHAESEEPQGDDNGLCANCALNQMGSADIGRGKACKNVRRLAVIGADDANDPESIRDAEVRVLKVPVMSVKGWALYVKNTLGEEVQRPYWCVKTNVKVVPDPKSQFRVVFTFSELIDIDEAMFTALEAKRKTIIPQISAPYQKIEMPAPTARGGRAVPPARAPAPAARGRVAPPAPAPVRGKSKY